MAVATVTIAERVRHLMDLARGVAVPRDSVMFYATRAIEKLECLEPLTERIVQEARAPLTTPKDWPHPDHWLLVPADAIRQLHELLREE